MHTDYYTKEVETGQERYLETRGPLLNIGELEVGLGHCFRNLETVRKGREENLQG